VHKWLLLYISLALPAPAADAGVLLRVRAQTDFDRVASSAQPSVQDTLRCVQSQAGMLAAARPAEVPAARFGRATAKS